MPKRRARGEGTIYQRKDGLWSAQIVLPDGRRRTKYGRSQREMRDWLAEQRSLARSSAWSGDAATSVREFVDRYLADVSAHRVQPQTLRLYQGYVDRYLYPDLGSLRLTQLRADHVQRLYSRMIERGLTAGTVQILHGIFGQAVEQARQWGLVALNPVRMAKVPSRRHAPPVLLTDDQLRGLLDSLHGYWLRTVVILAVGTGMRRGEIAGLHWRNVDLPAAVVKVEHNVVELAGGKLELRAPKTRGSRRSISLPLFVVDALAEHRETVDPAGMVFHGRAGRLLRPRTIDSAWGSRLAAQGLPRVPFHSLRHLHATKLLMAGVSAKVVQERLGHANIALTLGTYSHVTPVLEREAAEAIQRTTATVLLMQ